MPVSISGIPRCRDGTKLPWQSLPPEMYNFDLYDPDMLAAVKYPKYVFFIDTSLSTDFTEPDKYKPFEYIKTQIPADGYAEYCALKVGIPFVPTPAEE